MCIDFHSMCILEDTVQCGTSKSSLKTGTQPPASTVDHPDKIAALPHGEGFVSTTC